MPPLSERRTSQPYGGYEKRTRTTCSFAYNQWLLFTNNLIVDMIE